MQVRQEDEEKLKLLTYPIMLTYIAEAPPAAKERFQNEYWDKYHLSCIVAGVPGCSSSAELFLKRG